MLIQWYLYSAALLIISVQIKSPCLYYRPLIFYNVLANSENRLHFAVCNACDLIAIGISLSFLYWRARDEQIQKKKSVLFNDFYSFLFESLISLCCTRVFISGPVQIFMLQLLHAWTCIYVVHEEPQNEGELCCVQYAIEMFLNFIIALYSIIA